MKLIKITILLFILNSAVSCLGSSNNQDPQSQETAESNVLNSNQKPEDQPNLNKNIINDDTIPQSNTKKSSLDNIDKEIANLLNNISDPDNKLYKNKDIFKYHSLDTEEKKHLNNQLAEKIINLGDSDDDKSKLISLAILLDTQESLKNDLYKTQIKSKGNKIFEKCLHDKIKQNTKSDAKGMFQTIKAFFGFGSDDKEEEKNIKEEIDKIDSKDIDLKKEIESAKKDQKERGKLNLGNTNDTGKDGFICGFEKKRLLVFYINRLQE